MMVVKIHVYIYLDVRKKNLKACIKRTRNELLVGVLERWQICSLHNFLYLLVVWTI